MRLWGTPSSWITAPTGSLEVIVVRDAKRSAKDIWPPGVTCVIESTVNPTKEPLEFITATGGPYVWLFVTPGNGSPASPRFEPGLLGFTSREPAPSACITAMP